MLSKRRKTGEESGEADGREGSTKKETKQPKETEKLTGLV